MITWSLSIDVVISIFRFLVLLALTLFHRRRRRGRDLLHRNGGEGSRLGVPVRAAVAVDVDVGLLNGRTRKGLRLLAGQRVLDPLEHCEQSGQ